MLTSLLAAALCLLPADDRKANPFAPSLRELTQEEEDALDATINRFIASDIGQLSGAEARSAFKEFDKLGPDAIPALVRGLNRAADREASCPVASIASKLSKLLSSTRDRDLLDFVRENVGAGVGRTRHAAILGDLRTLCVVRKSALGRLPAAAKATPAATLRTLSVEELSRRAGSARGDALKAVLTELGSRTGDEALAALGSAAASYEDDIRQLARAQLDRHFAAATPARVRDKVSDDRAEVRLAAIRSVRKKGVRAEEELIARLTDEDATVRDAAHKALVAQARGVDHGPKPNATEKERAAAVAAWRAWLKKVR